MYRGGQQGGAGAGWRDGCMQRAVVAAAGASRQRRQLGAEAAAAVTRGPGLRRRRGGGEASLIRRWRVIAGSGGRGQQAGGRRTGRQIALCRAAMRATPAHTAGPPGPLPHAHLLAFCRREPGAELIVGRAREQLPPRREGPRGAGGAVLASRGRGGQRVWPASHGLRRAWMAEITSRERHEADHTARTAAARLVGRGTLHGPDPSDVAAARR